MLRSADVVEAFRAHGAEFWTGVPDSLLAPLGSHLHTTLNSSEHVIASSEGAAIALATGHYLASGYPAVVYLQNSGLGNTVNPLLSLVDPAVLGIPMVLVIGWRGEPDVADEPQHRVQGPATPVLLDGIGVPYAVLSDSIDTARTQIRDAVTEAIQGSGARALLVRRATFEAEAPLPVMNADRELCREDVVRAVTARIEPDALLVATTGKTARELFAVRAERGDSHHQDLLVVGSMGHANQVALGVALAQPERPVWILDGDGALLMHLGGLALIGSSGANIRHVAIVNGSHESVGGQPTPVGAVDFAAVAMGLGYAWATHAETADELDSAVDVLRRRTEPGFVEVRTRSGSRPGLARPDRTPADNKRAVMEHLLS